MEHTKRKLPIFYTDILKIKKNIDIKNDIYSDGTNTLYAWCQVTLPDIYL